MLKININEIIHDNVKLKLKKSLKVDFCKDEKYNTWYCDVPEYEVFASGLTASDVLLNLHENFAIAWKEYVDCNIEELSKDAIELRNKLIDLFEEEK